ncbi:MAG: hypothetical protein HZA54_16290 [Planctomycetes bacterium]|nr:hypothetical protein [Planctomycetota bacterium]
MRYAREPEPPTARIDALYDRLAVLRDELERTPQDPGLKAEFTAVFDRLRTLQENEARQIRQRLEKSLFAPLGSGDRLLAQTRDLLKKHADPATPNAPAVETDTPEA